MAACACVFNPQRLGVKDQDQERSVQRLEQEGT